MEYEPQPDRRENIKLVSFVQAGRPKRISRKNKSGHRPHPGSRNTAREGDGRETFSLHQLLAYLSIAAIYRKSQIRFRDLLVPYVKFDRTFDVPDRDILPFKLKWCLMSNVQVTELQADILRFAVHLTSFTVRQYVAIRKSDVERAVRMAVEVLVLHGLLYKLQHNTERPDEYRITEAGHQHVKKMVRS